MMPPNQTLRERVINLIGYADPTKPLDASDRFCLDLSAFLGLTDALHQRGDDDRCSACTEAFPCWTSTQIFNLCDKFLDTVQPPDGTYNRWVKDTWDRIAGGAD